MNKADTVYVSPGETFSVDAVKVPGGMLYVTSHHVWKVMNTVFVPDTWKTEVGKDYVNPQFVKEFLEGTR